MRPSGVFRLRMSNVVSSLASSMRSPLCTSVSVALDQLERYTQARIGGNHPPEATGRFIAARFEHDTAPPVDGDVAPQLHTQWFSTLRSATTARLAPSRRK